MQLVVTPSAQQWFKEEILLTSGQGIRFYGKIYGNTAVHEGFSVGMTVDSPEKPLVKESFDGILYFIEESDDWFFNGYDLSVDYDCENEEPLYIFKENALMDKKDEK